MSVAELTPAAAAGGGILTPEQWRDTLLGALADRLPQINKCDAYYRGRHRMAFSTAQFREVFGALFAAFSDNWCDLIVDASAERLRVEGFRLDDTGADADAWEIWQRNGLDAESDMAHTDAIKLGCVYALVGPDDDGKATIQVEPASQAIVYVDPAQGRRRLAGLRVWGDEWGTQHCALYLPDYVAWWRRDSSTARWQDAPGSGTNPLGIVPLVPLPNAPTLADRLGRSDIDRVIPLQDAVNKLACDMVVASEFAAYPQRWATGIEIPVNPETGERMPAQFLGGADRIWTAEHPDARFGNFTVSDLTVYVRAIEMMIQHVAAQTRTPPHYLLGAMGSFPSGESLKATETGLVAKVRRKQLSFGEGWEEALRLAFIVEGDSAKADAQTETDLGEPREPHRQRDRRRRRQAREHRRPAPRPVGIRRRLAAADRPVAHRGQPRRPARASARDHHRPGDAGAGRAARRRRDPNRRAAELSSSGADRRAGAAGAATPDSRK